MGGGLGRNLGPDSGETGTTCRFHCDWNVLEAEESQHPRWQVSERDGESEVGLALAGLMVSGGRQP